MAKSHEELSKTSSLNKTDEMTEKSISDLDSDGEQILKKPKKPLVEQLQAQLVRNQKKRLQARDYGKILNESNRPAQWYKAATGNRSVYYYNPHYQKYLPSKLGQQGRSNQRVCSSQDH